MARICSSIWTDQRFTADLTLQRQLLVLGLITLADNSMVVRGTLERIGARLGRTNLDSLQRDLDRLTDWGLVGTVEADPYFVAVDLDFKYAAKRPPLPRRLRSAVIERDGMVCALCGDSIPEGDLHIDHIHPVSKGGTDDLNNLQPAHSRCNISKGARV